MGLFPCLEGGVCGGGVMRSESHWESETTYFVTQVGSLLTIECPLVFKIWLPWEIVPPQKLDDNLSEGIQLKIYLHYKMSTLYYYVYQLY